MKIIHVVGARPNFMKVAPVISAMNEHDGFKQKLVHTGQHYDKNMSEIFFHQLEIPEPDINLEVGGGSHAAQTAQIMMRFEEVVLNEKPDWVLVYGDVNSTMAATLVSTKLGVKVAHVESGLRSFDRTMPEELNRLVTDQLSDLHFTPSKDGNVNLEKEGISQDKIHLVGNVMIDTLVRLLPKAEQQERSSLFEGVPKNAYCLVTLHRPSNVDNEEMLKSIFSTLNIIRKDIPIVFPIHPRTRQRVASLNMTMDESRFKLLDPVGYLSFLTLQRHAALVITDSGGIQEETTYLNVPCLTVRENTERPVTVSLGTNQLVGQDMNRLRSEVEKILNGDRKKGQIPPLWDGKSGKRIAEIMKTFSY